MTESVLHQTIQNLEGVLPELEEQERHLRNQLDAVVQQATSARSALEHLRVLTSADHSDRQPVAAGSAFAGVSVDATGAEAPTAVRDGQGPTPPPGGAPRAPGVTGGVPRGSWSVMCRSSTPS
ncbi:hypothetical protein ABT168_06540, partial [Streptomyces sp. NPDC001793]